MKKTNKILILITITMIAVVTFVLYLVNYQGLTLYFLLVSGDSGTGTREEELFKDLPTEKLIEIIETNKDFNEYTLTHATGYFKSGRFVGAISVLGSKIDKVALKKMREIIYNYPIGQKGIAIASIGRHKNKTMVPVLCNALKRHSYPHTDWLIVKALAEIDDPSALPCLIEEKDKLTLSYAREKAEETIALWKAGKKRK